MRGIEIYFRSKLLYRGMLEGDEIKWEGSPHGTPRIVEYYQRRGYGGEALLKILLERLHGNTWSQPIE